ncbi:MAG TPA: sulfur carrier protein ThiS [Longimicrobiaceae bacterium]
MTESIEVVLNGEEREVPSGVTVRGLLEHLDLKPEMVVVERNGDILRRDRYAEVPVEEGDVLELVHFVGGG